MTSLRDVYIGIDIHSVEHSVAVLPLESLESPQALWKKINVFKIENCRNDFMKLERKIKHYAASPQKAAIAIDQTGTYSAALTYFLRNKGYPVFFAEPISVKGIKYHLLGEENKNDENDARGFAYFLYLKDKHTLPFRLSEVTEELDSTPAVLKSLFLQRNQYVKVIIETSSRLHRLFNVVFPEAERAYFKSLIKITDLYPTPEDIIKAAKCGEWSSVNLKNRTKILTLAKNSVGVQSQHFGATIRFFTQLLTDATNKRVKIEEIIEKEVLRHPYGAILCSFPSLGLIDIALLISIIGNIDRWENDRKLRKALGVYPVFSVSGKSVSRVRQGKEGNAHARSMLFRVIMRCLLPHTEANDFRDYFIRLRMRGKPGRIAVMSTAGKLAETIHHCLLKKETYQYKGVYRPHKIPTSFLEKYYGILKKSVEKIF